MKMVRDLKIFVLENIRYFVTTGNLVTRKIRHKFAS
jgi:hypothetical protein